MISKLHGLRLTKRLLQRRTFSTSSSAKFISAFSENKNLEDGLEECLAQLKTFTDSVDFILYFSNGSYYDEKIPEALQKTLATFLFFFVSF